MCSRSDVIATLLDVDTYRKSISRVCRKAKIPEWSPNRLRHNATTRIRMEFGVEDAQVIPVFYARDETARDAYFQESQ
ncbi:hypothetical protein CA54_40540 [Symmachiella macrocystis]|uniref:Uncharacterized protein n=1 Tax=Symmachiella macrocystis TaxID=2527985 RepID=A0A5C6BAS2_9PLAN|nr:hypothetical protein CA54_40540 [Symmachiella macrocystis]